MEGVRWIAGKLRYKLVLGELCQTHGARVADLLQACEPWKIWIKSDCQLVNLLIHVVGVDFDVD